MPKRGEQETKSETTKKTALMRAFDKLLEEAGLQDKAIMKEERTMQVGDEKTKVQVIFSTFKDGKEDVKELSFAFQTTETKLFDKYSTEIYLDEENENEPHFLMYVTNY